MKASPKVEGLSIADYKKSLEAQIKNGVECVDVKVDVNVIDGVPMGASSTTLTIKGKFTWEAAKIVRLMKENGLDQ